MILADGVELSQRLAYGCLLVFSVGEECMLGHAWSPLGWYPKGVWFTANCGLAFGAPLEQVIAEDEDFLRHASKELRGVELFNDLRENRLQRDVTQGIVGLVGRATSWLRAVLDLYVACSPRMRIHMSWNGP